jgi:beta-lactamase regulating signal transducer with metallopeptidase domain
MHMLVNWLWQGMAIALLAAAVLRATRVSAAIRDVVWWITLLLVLALPVLPALFALAGAPPPLPGAPAALAAIPTPPISAWPVTIVLTAWGAWVAFMLMRVLLSLVSLAAARRRAKPFCAERESRLEHWIAARTSGRRARLAYSDRVQSAAVFGLGEAVIALSPAAAAHLTDEELDQVVLHEWAHVQRRDDLARIVQLLVHAVAGLHPAVWWIDRRLQIEREIACDDVTIQRTGQALSLARCLTKIAELPRRGALAAPMPAVLVRSQLALRVRRLLDPQRDTTTRRAGRRTGLLAVFLIAAAVLVSRLELVVDASPVSPAVPVIAPQIPSQTAAPPAPAGDAETVITTPETRETSPASPPGLLNGSTSAPGVARSVVAPPSAGLAAVPALDLPPVLRSTAAWVPELPAVSGAPLEGSVVVSEEAAGEGEPPTATPWGAAADAGVSVGRGSQKAAIATADAGVSVGRTSQKAATATAGFFTKLSRKIAGSF